MTRHFDESTFPSLRSDASCLGAPRPIAVSFVQKLAASDGFKALFKEGMALVEESAAYLDGGGRDESRLLRRPLAMAYASESMRLTTRLMQLASWLLLQRAVNEGQMTVAQATSEKHRVRLTRQDVGCAPDLFEELPVRLRTLILKSVRLQARILHLDQSLSSGYSHENISGPGIVASQVERLRMAFAAH